MKTRILETICFTTLAALVTIPTLAGEASAVNELVAVNSRHLDEVRLRPGLHLGAYESVLVEPARVEFHPNLTRNLITYRVATPRLSAEDARKVADDFSASLERSLAEAFRANGYRIATAPGPGVLRLSPAITELYVNTPEALISSGGYGYVFAREAGDAVLTLQVHDATTGTVLASIKHHGHATGVKRFTRTNDVTMRFWFDALFDHWARSCAREIVPGSDRTLSRLGKDAVPRLSR